MLRASPKKHKKQKSRGLQGCGREGARLADIQSRCQHNSNSVLSLEKGDPASALQPFLIRLVHGPWASLAGFQFLAQEESDRVEQSSIGYKTLLWSMEHPGHPSEGPRQISHGILLVGLGERGWLDPQLT